MKHSSTLLLQVIIVLIGIGAFAFLLWEPHVEGVNQHATVFQIYFQDPFLAYVYLSSIPFFVALYQVFKVLGYVDQDQVFSRAAVKALRTTRYCAIAIVVLVAASVGFMLFTDPEDRPAGLFLRLLIGFPSVIAIAAASMFERILQHALNIKCGNDSRV